MFVFINIIVHIDLKFFWRFSPFPIVVQKFMSFILSSFVSLPFQSGHSILPRPKSISPPTEGIFPHPFYAVAFKSLTCLCAFFLLFENNDFFLALIIWQWHHVLLYFTVLLTYVPYSNCRPWRSNLQILSAVNNYLSNKVMWRVQSGQLALKQYW